MKDLKTEAIRLVNHFTLNKFMVDETSSNLMVAFAKFAAIQHLTEITTFNQDPETIVQNLRLASEIQALEISYPL
jgi:predicted transcriptional regulator